MGWKGCSYLGALGIFCFALRRVLCLSNGFLLVINRWKLTGNVYFFICFWMLAAQLRGNLDMSCGVGVFWAIFSLALILHNLQEDRTFYKPMKQSPNFYFIFQVFRQPITLLYISFGKIWILAEAGCKTASYKYHIAMTKRNGERYICNIKSKNKFSLDRFPSKVDEFARRCSTFSSLISVL